MIRSKGRRKWEIDMWDGRVFKDTGKPVGCEITKRKNKEIPLVYFSSSHVSNN